MIPAPVRARFPWPEEELRAQPYLVDLDGGGRHLIDRELASLPPNATLLEIGSFLGGSTLRWLSRSPTLQVMAIDIWPDGDESADYLASGQWWFDWEKPNLEVQRSLKQKNGLFHTFLANVSPYRDRVVAARAKSQDVLEELFALGLKPSIIYIDADKKRSDLDTCYRLWPDAKLTGDDYLWNREAGYPMQQHVNEFAKENGLRVLYRSQTWVLTRVPA